MPVFPTPEPIAVTIELSVADIHIAASERADTLVEVRPTDPARAADVAAAEQTRVEYAAGKLLIKSPPGKWRHRTFRGGSESVDVQIDLPAGSQVRLEAGIAALHGTGRLGECSSKTGMGDVQLEETGAVNLKTGAGDISLGQAAGAAQVTTGSGAIRIGRVDGSGVIKASNGDTWIGEVTGDLQVKAANGSIVVDRTYGTVAAKTARGDIRFNTVTGGAVLAQTAYGQVDIGVLDGVAAWLDLDTSFGEVQSDLEAAGAPEPGAGTAEIVARTSYGDIAVHRRLEVAP
jgi:DUF4097 and DUF4098 domain-containing protein YvlB